jgi:hypothetical protein
VPSEQFSNNAVTTLASSITDGQTAIPVVSNDGLPSVTTASGDWFYATINNEIIKVTNNPTLLWTAERGNQGTTAAAHGANTPVYATVTKKTMDDILAAVANVGAPTLAGTFASRPVSAIEGTLYYASDHIYTYRYNGSSWDAYYLNRIVTPPPSQAAFSWINQGGATATDVGGAIQFNMPSSGTNNMRCKIKPYTAPYTVECGILSQGNIANFFSGGLIIQNGVNPLIIHSFASSNNNVSIGMGKYNSPTSFNSGYAIGAPTFMPFTPVYLKYEDNGVNRLFSASFNGGVSYDLLQTIVRTDFLTPVNVGFGFESINGTNSTRSTIFHWKEY